MRTSFLISVIYYYIRSSYSIKYAGLSRIRVLQEVSVVFLINFGFCLDKYPLQHRCIKIIEFIISLFPTFFSMPSISNSNVCAVLSCIHKLQLVPILSMQAKYLYYQFLEHLNESLTCLRFKKFYIRKLLD